MNDTPQPIDPKRRFLCRHIHTKGQRCGSPALRGQNFCYYHNRAHREAPISGRSGTFPMPRVDDRAAIQIALYEVLSRLSSGDIEYKRGSILLYGLQIASANLPRHAQSDAASEAQPQVEEIASDFHLGDLAPIAEIRDAEPETAAPPTEIAPSSETVPSTETALLSETNEVPGQLAEWGVKDPGTQPAPPENLPLVPEPVIPVEEPATPPSHHDRRRPNRHPLTLAAVHAAVSRRHGLRHQRKT